MTAVATQEDPGTDVALARRATMLRPVAKVAELLQLQDEIAGVVTSLLKEGTDYGKIPGTDKPVLLKPGAERMNLAFGCVANYEVVEQEIDHSRHNNYVKSKKVWRNAHQGDRVFTLETQAGESTGLYRYVVRCRIVNRATGEIVGEGVGSASTMETKYVDRPQDLENTVLKMSQKRALVAASLNAYALSDRFTQDLEDGVGAGGDVPDGKEEKDLPPPTAETAWPFGKHKGKKIGELEISFMKWATESTDRKFGDAAATKIWQDALRLEIDRREGRAPDAAPAASRPDAGGDTVLRLPGDATKWNGHGGKPLAECASSLLTAFVRWCATDENRAALYDAESQEAQRLVAARNDGAEDMAGAGEAS